MRFSRVVRPSRPIAHWWPAACTRHERQHLLHAKGIFLCYLLPHSASSVILLQICQYNANQHYFHGQPLTYKMSTEKKSIVLTRTSKNKYKKKKKKRKLLNSWSLSLVFILNVLTCCSISPSHSQHPPGRCLVAHVPIGTQDPGPSQNHLSCSDTRWTAVTFMFPLTPTALLEPQNLVHVIYHAGVRASNKCSKWSAFFIKQFCWEEKTSLKQH